MSFPATRWSVVIRAKDWTDDARAARDELCETYYYPVYSYFRKTGFDQDSAYDHTNNFFVEFLSGKRVKENLLRNADPNRGIAFRAYVIVSIKSYLSNERRTASAQKRGGQTFTTSFDEMNVEQRYLCEPCYLDSAEQQLSLSWALGVVEKALAQTKKDFGDRRFGALKKYLVGRGDSGPYAETAKELEMSEGGIKQAVSRLRKVYQRNLHGIIAETVSHPDDIEDEWNELFNILRNHIS